MWAKAVFFDLFGTVFMFRDPESASHSWIEDLHTGLSENGVDVDSDCLATLCEGWFDRPVPPGGRAELTVFERRIDHLAVQLGLRIGTPAIQRISSRVSAGWTKHVVLDDHTVPVLTVLKRRHLLGAISNFDHPPIVRSLLKETGILRFFDTITLSSDVGIRKPDPAIFLLAAQRTNVSSPESVFVGDSHVEAVAAASSGMHAIFLSRGLHQLALDTQRNQRLDVSLTGTPSLSKLAKQIRTISVLTEVLTLIQS